MDVVNGRSEGGDDRDRIHPLPDQVRGVHVRPDDLADLVAQGAQGRDVVDELERVELERDPDPGVDGPRRELPPQPDHLLPPPPLEVEELVGPGVDRPVHGRRGRSVARAAGHRDDGPDAEEPGELERLLDDRPLLGSATRMEEPGRAVQGREPEPATGQLVEEGGPLVR